MTVSGKIIKIMDEQSGESSTGSKWRKKEFVIETQNTKYPKKICLSMRGDIIDTFNYSVGDDVRVSIDIVSREYNDRYYTDIKAWKIVPNQSGRADETTTTDDASPF